jgi:hypothetical protein
VVEDSRRVASGKRLKEFPDRYHGHVRRAREAFGFGALGQFEFDLVVPQGTVSKLVRDVRALTKVRRTSGRCPTRRQSVTLGGQSLLKPPRSVGINSIFQTAGRIEPRAENGSRLVHPVLNFTKLSS